MKTFWYFHLASLNVLFFDLKSAVSVRFSCFLYPERHLGIDVSPIFIFNGGMSSVGASAGLMLTPVFCFFLKVRREYRKFFRANAGKKIYEFTIQRIVSLHFICGLLALLD